MMKRICYLLLIILLIGFWLPGQAQIPKDSLSAKALDSVVISTSARFNQVTYLSPVDGVAIYSGKKTNVVLLDPARANLAQNVSRQLFAQIPGLTIWDMDGAGTQINIGSRGTDTHRSIEMNMRQNGYNINSDMFGYPEAHYTPPMQGIQKLELVRGSAALQFGPQFGGMLNYAMKEGDTTKSFSIESEQTIGSNNFFNSFNSVGGKKGRWTYYGYYDNRHGDGWRKNAAFNYHAYYASIKYDFNEKANIALQLSRMDYVQQIAGGLTDAQFYQNARQSFRSRNFFSPNINMPALLFHYRFNAQTRLQVITHYLFGQRNSVQFLNTPNIADTVNTSLGSYNPRQVDRDYYSGFTTEARLLHQFKIGSLKNTLATGFRYFIETTRRRQKGVGTTGSDYYVSLVKPYGIDLRFHTVNYAAFAEDMLQLSSRLSLTPGLRCEMIETHLTGIINNATYPVSYSSTRRFLLFGAGVQYAVKQSSEIYGNVSQAYRPYLYANVTPADRVDIVDPNLKDSKGYDIDLGYRGKIRDIVKFDVNGYYLFYGNRIGQLTLKDGSNSSYLYTTNIGDAVSKGIEAYVSVAFLKLLTSSYSNNTFYKFHLFNSLSYTHARYLDAQINKSGTNVSLKGNELEGVPQWTNRTGLAWQHKMFTAVVNYTYLSRNFSDANNTVFNATGATGIVPAYHLWDLSLNWKFLHSYSLSGGINNIGDARYFTRRINMYPGPGILPGDGRTFYISLGAKM